MKIVFDDSNYRQHWGKAPRGGNKFKMWAFSTDAIPGKVLFGCGEFKDAKELVKWKIKQACKGQGIVTVQVLWT